MRWRISSCACFRSHRMEETINALNALSGIMNELAEAGRLSGEAIKELGREIRRLVSELVAQLTPEERRRYDALLAEGMLPLDALGIVWNDSPGSQDSQ